MPTSTTSGSGCIEVHASIEPPPGNNGPPRGNTLPCGGLVFTGMAQRATHAEGWRHSCGGMATRLRRDGNTPAGRWRHASPDMTRCQHRRADLGEGLNTLVAAGESVHLRRQLVLVEAIKGFSACAKSAFARPQLPASASSQHRKATSEAFQLMAISLEAYDSVTSRYDSSGMFEG